MVEFALVGPIFLVMTFFIVESALLLNAQATLDNATREAARIGALCGGSIGTWTSPSGGQYSNGTQGSPCPHAIAQTVLQNTGFLKTTGTNPAVGSVAPATGSPAYCSAGVSGLVYYAPAGCTITVNVTYTYAFLLNFIVGPSAPAITLQSSATTISQ
jgi:Flp pilus assembly protein TadG